MLKADQREKALWEGSADRRAIEDLIRTLGQNEQDSLRERYLKEEKQEKLEAAAPLSPQGRDIMTEILSHSETSINTLSPGTAERGALDVQINSLPQAEQERIRKTLNERLEACQVPHLSDSLSQ